MNILVTAGNTQTPVDRVRCITNVFSGRTGAHIAARGYDRGHTVVLLTSHPEVLDAIPATRPRIAPDWRTRTYRTFDDLEAAMGEEIPSEKFDVVVHAAAVSDYRVAGIFEEQNGKFAEVSSGKVKSTYPELWLKLVPTPKLVDRIRAVWGFSGVLVKFKLEVGWSDAELMEVAEKARTNSAAELMVANTLEGMHEWAFIGAADRGYRKVTRAELADYLLDAIESIRTIGS
ncbi:MAG TPA: phosphopantothenoylcysteine decarboxylase [Gemmata sp.]|nr:phosphopantothenoylcysteine decarboxylase [Gemmata sp.]